MTLDPTPVQHPFSTALSLKILKLIQERDLHMLDLRNKYQAGELTIETFTTALELSEQQITDEIFTSCQSVFASLETTVNKVLQLQAQMKVLRDLEAEKIVGPGAA